MPHPVRGCPDLTESRCFRSVPRNGRRTRHTAGRSARSPERSAPESGSSPAICRSNHAGPDGMPHGPHHPIARSRTSPGCRDCRVLERCLWHHWRYRRKEHPPARDERKNELTIVVSPYSLSMFLVLQPSRALQLGRAGLVVFLVRGLILGGAAQIIAQIVKNAFRALAFSCQLIISVLKELAASPLQNEPSSAIFDSISLMRLSMPSRAFSTAAVALFNGAFLCSEFFPPCFVSLP